VALVVLLRGVNVGGHRTFRPTKLAEQLRHLDVVNVGAAGTFVVWRPITQMRLRAQVRRRLPFEAEIIICRGRDITSLASQDFFADHPVRSDVIRFVTVLSRRPTMPPPVPLRLPPGGKWFVKVLARENRFVVGVYRRHMRVLRYLGELDRLFGLPATTRNWNTITAVGQLLNDRKR